MVHQPDQSGQLQNRPVQYLTDAPNRAETVLRVIRDVYGMSEGEAVPLHAPVFGGRESEYVQETIRSTFVSYVGAYVSQFERMLCNLTGARHAIATVNGTTALQLAFKLAGIERDDVVITQSLSFVGTANAIVHAGGVPAFVDVDFDTLGMSPTALARFLDENCRLEAGVCRFKKDGARVAACAPMHSFGHPVRLTEILEVCADWNVTVVEDAAEALGSTYRGRHCGTFGKIGALSFNGNKVVTTGGGGAILTDDDEIARRAKHLTTTAKVPHRWRFFHDEVGYNLRMPNLNAALGCAQMERLDEFLAFKRDLADRYRQRFEAEGIEFLSEPIGTRSNYWLCAVLVDESERDAVLELTNDAGVMTRPVWEPLHTLPAFRDAAAGPLPNTLNLAARLINIPSGFKERRP